MSKLIPVLSCFAILASLLASNFAHSADAQTPATDVKFDLPTTQGHWILGGGFWATKYQESSEWTISVSPQVKYFLIDRLALGLATDFSWPAGTEPDQYVGPSLTYYFYQTDRWAFSLEQAMMYTVTNSFDAGNTSTRWSTSLGASYFFNKNAAFTPTIQYSYGGPSYVPTQLTVSGTFQLFFE